MPSRTTSLATMAVLSLILLTMLVVGLLATTAPFPKTLGGSGPAAICTKETFEKGDRIPREDITVSVLNAGTESGAAEKVLTSLVAAGFAKGTSGNGPQGLKVPKVRVLTETEGDPVAAEVARQFGVTPRVSDNASKADGVVVLIGNDAPPVKPVGKRVLVAPADGSYCKAAADPEVEPVG